MKNTASIAVLFVFAAMLSASVMAKDLYKSIGPDGKVIYSDHPLTEARVEKTMKAEKLPGSGLPAATSAQIEQLRRQQAGSTPALAAGQVVIYTASWCGYCRKAKAYLASKGISYQEYDIDTEQGRMSYAQAGGGRGVPLLLYGGKRIQGYSAEAYDALFGG